MSSVESRHQSIINKIEEKGSAFVSELAETLDVSEMTIRRDFRDLENLGLIKRFHGGAMSSRGRSYEPPLLSRNEENLNLKKMIGKYAADMVIEGDSIALDVGSTIYQIAVNLKNIKNITLLTPSLFIAELFLDNSDIKLILPGGVVRPVEHSLIGEFARRNITQLFFDRLFLGAGGIHSNYGVTEFNFDDALIKQSLIKNSKEIILVADSSKFQKTAFAQVSDLNRIDRLVTDSMPPQELRKSLDSAGVTIHLVS